MEAGRNETKDRGDGNVRGTIASSSARTFCSSDEYYRLGILCGEAKIVIGGVIGSMQSNWTEAEQFIADFMVGHNVPGLAVAVAQDEEIIYEKGFGHRDLAIGAEVTPNTIFGVASLTKSVTAISVAKLVDQGKLKFDDLVIKHLPEFRLPGGADPSAVRIRHLLTHTSGMPALDALSVSFKSHSSPDSEDPMPIPLPETPVNTYNQMMAYVGERDVPVLDEPGRIFNYSNESYAILGALVRRVSSMSFATFVRRYIIEPLGMEHSTMSFEEMYEHEDVTILYTKKSGGALQASTRWPCAPAMQAEGRMKSNVRDFIRVFQMYNGLGRYRGVQVLSEGAVRENTAEHFRHSLCEGYGHAVHVQPDYKGYTVISHGGAGKGISAHGGYVPGAGLSVMVLANLGGVPVRNVWGALVNVGLGLPLATPRCEYTRGSWEADEVTNIPGLYKTAEGADFAIEYCEGRLLHRYKDKESEICKIGEMRGLLTENGVEQEMKFYVAPDGSIKGVGKGSRFITRVVDVI